MSQSLGPAARAGLVRLGDVLVPGDGELPSFSKAGAAEHAERFLAALPPDDRAGLRLLLGLFGFLPRFVLRGLVALAGRHARFPELLAGPLRKLELGLKGIVMTLYYADLGDARIHPQIGWDARVVETAAAQDAAPETEPLPEPARAEPPASNDPASAVARARDGALSLRRLSARERAAFLARLREVVLRRREEIVDRIQGDTGKSRTDALVSEIFGVLDNLAWLEKAAPRALADRKVHTPIALLGKRSELWFEPLGTILVIAPWNYPFYQAVVPIACAFAAGNTVVFKPSEWTPLEGLVEDLLAEAGFAPNWVRVVYGDGRVGEALIDARPDKVFFTGSTRTGRRILARAAPHGIPVELELGGKDAMIVFEDVDVERAAAGAAWGALTTTGQSCTSVERLLVHEAIYEPFRAALLREVGRLRPGVDRDGDAELGFMTADFQVEIVRRHVEDARAKGARLLTGAEWDGRSRCVPPLVIEGVTDAMLVAQEETFGPVIPLRAFRDEAEAIALANAGELGLTASVWSRDLERARRVARALVVGGVSVNNVMATEANPALPFGGTRASGFGRYKGELGLHSFCNVKSVLIDKDSGKIEANWYPYTRAKYRLFSAMMEGLFGRGLRRWARFAWNGLRLERESQRAHRDR